MTSPSFPAKRLRRMRRDSFSRALMRETSLAASDLIYPIHIVEGNAQRLPIASLPGVSRVSVDHMLDLAEECLALGIPAIALQPVIDQALRTPDGTEALNNEGLLPRAVSAVKSRFPQLGVVCDVSLSPYTMNAQPGPVSSGSYVLNDETVALLTRQAVMLARAGADILALPDTLDGQVRAIRAALEQAGLPHTRIMAASANYVSSLNGPFGEHYSSTPSLTKVDRDTCQIDPANSSEALREARMDLDEGADIIAIKPGMMYLDLVYRIAEMSQAPTVAYQVGGEYAMLKAAAQNGWVIHDRVVIESITAFKRAGADAIVTFFARDLARLLQQHQ